MLLIAFTGLLLVAFLAVLIGWLIQRRAVAASTDRITRAAVPVEPHPENGLDTLPPPVSRDLHWALAQAPSVRLVRIGQTGTLRTDTSSDRWMPFEAEHLVAPGAISFLWNARITAAPLFRFAETGEVTGIYTPARWGTFGGGYEQRPWEGHFRDYEQRGGIWVPREGDVGWYVGAEWHPVWRGTIVRLRDRVGISAQVLANER